MSSEETDAGLNRLQDLLDAQFSGTSDDDDISFEPGTEEESEESEDDGMQAFLERLVGATRETDGEEDEDDNDEYEDASENFSTIEVEIEGEEDSDDTEIEDTPAIMARRQQVLRLLAGSNIGRLFLGGGGFGRRRRAPLDPDRFPKVPSIEGQNLMDSGNFGFSELRSTHSLLSKKKIARRVLDRELGIEEGPRGRTNQQLMAQDMIPSTKADMIVHYEHPVYSGQFSADGNFFYSCVKDFKVRMYDTSNPYKWRYYKTVVYPYGQWTLTDATLSPDNKYLAYTSIQPVVCLAPTDPNDMGDPYNLDLSDSGRRRRGAFDSRSFGIWSIRFSKDGRELVAGTTAKSIVVYDIESRQSVFEVHGHTEDVNSICASPSGQIVFSGSDDTTIKMWDRRSMDSREAGAFLGHTEGITYIDIDHQDGRYILSNGKDQSMKLWDLRKAMSTARLAEVDPSMFTENFDYRWDSYDDSQYTVHPHDNSLVTFRGHKVLRTLIRCHFSPPGSTNSRYVYSASADGKVTVYNLDATVAGVIDVKAATMDSRPYDLNTARRAWHDDEDRQAAWNTCVRDVAWHPTAPIIAASSLNGYGMSCGTVSVHSWNDGADDDEGDPKMGLRVDDQLRQSPHLYETI